ncbi:MAG: LPS-assembly protein LptD [Opitutales bacterium]|nr:LPS-assembly protein LptD [Opitutales bacterium]
MRMLLCICLVANVSFVCAETAKLKTTKRADVPWISLAHQRALAKQAQEEAKKKTPVKKVKSLVSDKRKYSQDGVITATGNVRVDYDKLSAQARKARYSQKANAVRVMDDVRLSVDKARLITTATDISIDGKSMKTDYARFGTYPLYVKAQSVSGSEKEIVLEKSRAYFGEPASAALSAETEKTTYNPETKEVHMDDVWIKIDEIPFLYLPSYSVDADDPFPWEIRNRIDYNSDYGIAIQNTVHYTGYEQFAPGFLLDGYTKRSLLAGPAFRYNVKTANNIMFGSLQTGFIYDTGSREDVGENFFGRNIDRERYFVEYRHNQLYRDKLGLTAVISAWSDEYVTRDFRDDFFSNNQTPDNFVEGIYYGNMWTSSIFTRFAPNNWELVQQRLPEVRADVQPVELFNTGAYVRGFASAAYLHQYNPYPNYYTYVPNESIKSKRIDGYVGIDRPIQISDWFKVTPVAGARATSYFDTASGSSNYTRTLAQVGFDAQMDIWGQFEWESKTMKIDGLRHHLMPILSYRYIPEAEKGKRRINAIDYDYFTTYPPILDLGNMRNIDDMSELNTLRFGFKNVFETRDKEFGSRELARFDVFQDINFKRRRPPLRYKYWTDDEYNQDYSELYVNFSVSPARWLTTGVYTRMSIEHATVPEIHPYITLMESDVASITLGVVYLENQEKLNQYYAMAEYRISERYQVFGSWHYDAELSEFIYQQYGLRTKLGNTWLIEYYISHRTGSTRENSTSFGANIVILGI